MDAEGSQVSQKIQIVGGMPVGRDGRVHTTFTQNPSTLRFSSTGPNLQNIPRDSGLGRMVKEIFIADPGKLLWERDFSAIEAVLVGYFAGDPTYIRFAKMGVHAYLASHIVKRPADLNWSDGDLKAYFKQLKKEENDAYNIAKRIVHMSNYLGTPKRIYQLWPESFPSIGDAARLQSLYLDLFPAISRWHRSLAVRVDGTKQRRRGEVDQRVDPWTLGVCYVQNPFGYVHRFYNVLDWDKVDGEWVSSFGEDAKRLVAFLPQSTAAAIIKRATRIIWNEYPWVGETLRLLIHDSILGEAQEEEIETCLKISQEVMEAPIPELPLDPSWGLGDCLAIGSEAKVGRTWADMN